MPPFKTYIRILGEDIALTWAAFRSMERRGYKVWYPDPTEDDEYPRAIVITNIS